MKKVLKLFSIMAIMLILLTGCVNVNYEVTLNSDGTADIAYIYGFDKEYLEEMGASGKEMTGDMQENAELSNYKIEDYSDDKIEGFKATKHVTDLAEISLEEAFGEENVKDSEENKINIEKKGAKTVYSQNAQIDLTSMDSSMSSMVTMKYTINLPIKAGKNNASEVSKDGKTLTWNLKAGEINKIEFEATEQGTFAKVIKIVLIVVAVIAVIAIIAFVINLIIKKTKKKNEDKNEEIETETETVEIMEEDNASEEKIEENNVEVNKEQDENKEDTEKQE